MKNQTPELCMAAVQERGRALYYVEHQTPDVCIAAIRENSDSMKYIDINLLEMWLNIASANLN